MTAGMTADCIPKGIRKYRVPPEHSPLQPSAMTSMVPPRNTTFLILVTYKTSFTMRGATCVTLQPHQILRLPRKMTAENLTEILWKQLKRHLQWAADLRMIREWTCQSATRRATQVTFRAHDEHFCVEKYKILRSGYLSKFHLRLTTWAKNTRARLNGRQFLPIFPCHFRNILVPEELSHSTISVRSGCRWLFSNRMFSRFFQFEAWRKVCL